MLAEMLAFVERFCRTRGIGDDHRLRVTLVVEELFTNTVAHGHRGGAEAPIRVALAMDGEDVTIVYEDQAPPYDPLRASPVDPLAHSRDVAARPVGGLGVLLVGQLAVDARYAREDGRNRLWLRIPGRRDAEAHVREL
jgi:anti-sigma regulatory factor (Ser/Thr protein kinase)